MADQSLGDRVIDSISMKDTRDKISKVARQASEAIDRGKKTARDTYTKYRDKAKRAVSSGRSRSR